MDRLVGKSDCTDSYLKGSAVENNTHLYMSSYLFLAVVLSAIALQWLALNALYQNNKKRMFAMMLLLIILVIVVREGIVR